MKTIIKNKTNEEFIREWLWEHNLYLHGREDKEFILNRLVAIVIIFEKVKGINEKDSVIKRDNMIRVVTGPAITCEKAIHILKLVNYEYGYLQYKDMQKFPACKWLESDEQQGVLEVEDMKVALGAYFAEFEHAYGENDFERKVYVINGKVFYADQKLTSEEKAYIKENERGEQLQYDVDHHKGRMHWW